MRIAATPVALVVLAAPGPHTLREAASASGALVGTAVRSYALSEAAYSATIAQEFDMVEPEDAMKWWTVRPSSDRFDFAQGDQIVRFAIAHGMKVRGHCLVWDHNNPKWLAESHFTPDQLSHLLQEHITTEMKHFAGQVFAWDVVNEAMNANGKLKDSIWFNKPGIGLSDKNTAYVEQAIRWAHEADPGALLFYNDADGEGLSRKSDAIFAMVKDFRSRGVPIDGVGLQMHIDLPDFDSDAVARNIRRLTNLGLQVHITELDVSLPVDSKGIVRTEDLSRQAEIYAAVVRACMKNPGCTAIQTWGFTDKYSWISSHTHGTRGAALPFDRAYRPKPAYESMLKELTAGRQSTH
ncbi:MAG TPA: endo-1,4-beta-xylanase [Candidatus Binatia bacterium]|nr:endo-1,4-beta-xylanase [Candidatus Binatia bacterium]